MSANLLSAEDDGINRRESFRIDDTLVLRVRLLDEESLESISDDFDAFRLRYGMKTHMQNQKNVRKPKLLRIRKSNADVADYLESLEAQIVQLADRLDEYSDVSGDSVEATTEANLSATGIQYVSNEPLEKGQHIEIGMDLSTQNLQVVTLGEVLRAEPQDKDKFAVTVKFTHIHREDTDTLVRHMAKLQQLQLQARRGLED